MESKYDQNEWEQGTTLGRRLFIHNFGMRGDEFTGWELIKTVVTEDEPGMTEKRYLWKRKKSRDEELIQVSVIESAYWRHAQQHLMNRLHHCMRPDIPRGKGATAKIGDIQYIGQTADNKQINAVFFSRGNLQFAVHSVGQTPVDVTKFADKLDRRLIKPPAKAEEKSGRVSALKPAKVTVKKDLKAVLIDKLPKATPRSGWIKVMAAEGELRRDGDALYISVDKEGAKSVQVLNYRLD